MDRRISMLALMMSAAGCGSVHSSSNQGAHATDALRSDTPTAAAGPAVRRLDHASAGLGGYPFCTNGSDTGHGFGWDPSVAAADGSHSCRVPIVRAPILVRRTTDSIADADEASSPLPALRIRAAADGDFRVHDYGATLQERKAVLVAAAHAAGATAQERAVIVAIAMQETTTMSPDERDSSKDATTAANCSVLNLNYGMLIDLGYDRDDYGASLNVAAELPRAVGYLVRAFHTWGIGRTLDYHRGGATAFADGISYGALAYRSAVATIYAQIAADRSFEKDGRRVEIDVPAV